jgi:hypothetical protein
LDEPVDPAKSRHRRKRVAQWRRWDLEIIPALSGSIRVSSKVPHNPS